MDPEQPQQKKRFNSKLFTRNIWSARSSKSKRIVALGLAVLLVVAGGGLYGYKRAQDENAKKAAQTAQELTVQETVKTPLTVPEQTKQTQQAILTGEDTLTSRLTLAKLFESQGNKKKAIFNYEKALALAKPSDPDYQSNVDAIQEALIRLKGKQ